MAEKINNFQTEEIAKFCAQIAEDKKAENISVIKVKDISMITDYFVLCTGTSQPHLRAIAEWIRRKVREKYQIRPISVDGETDNNWTVLDFGDIIVHILSMEARVHYQLEDLWGDAEKIVKNENFTSHNSRYTL